MAFDLGSFLNESSYELIVSPLHNAPLHMSFELGLWEFGRDFFDALHDLKSSVNF